MDKEDSVSRNSASKNSPLRNEDEAITTSTESDTFESWTLITDKQKKRKAGTEEPTNPQSNKTEPEFAEQQQKPTSFLPQQQKVAVDNAADDVSDGISIISESGESVGRLSPHPQLSSLLSESLPAWSSRFHEQLPASHSAAEVVTGDTDEETQLRPPLRRRKRSASTQSERKSLQPAEELPLTEEEKPVDLATRITSHPLVRRGLNGLFYVGVALGLLALIGRLRNPEWIAGSGQGLADLELKFNELELQNNLMRAEIDILTKQVNYLSAKQDPSSKKWKGPDKDAPKTFKAWSGLSMDEVHISKEDLKRPYKVEAEEKKEQKTAPLADQSMQDMLQDSETFKSFEAVAEAFLSKGGQQQQPQQRYKDYRTNSKDFKDKPAYQRKPHSHEHHDYDHDDDDDDDDSHEHGFDGKRAFNNNKKQQGYNRNSKERFKHQHDPNWHENLMQQREQLRRQQHAHDQRNWYMERADARDQARAS